MASQATGIDVSTAGSVFLRGHAKGNTFVVTHFGLSSESADSLEAAWEAAEPGFPLVRACIGVTGREVNLRYSRVPRLPDWQLEKLMRFEIAGVGDSSESEVAGDFNVLPDLPELEGEDVVLLALAKESLLASHREGLAALKGPLEHFSPNAVALYNAWLRFGVVLDDTVLLASIGRSDIDLVIVRGADLVFARNLGGGTELFERALEASLGQASAREALGRVDLTPGARLADARAERATQAAQGPAGQLAGLLQSSVLFAKSQIKLGQLNLDRLFLCGPGAEIPGLAAYLGRALSCATEVFDPFLVVDTTKLAEPARAELEAHKARAVIALGLATAGSWDQAYGIQILPAAEKRRREFLQGTLFLILAAAVLLISLGIGYQQRSARLGKVRDDVARLKRDVRAGESNDAETRQLLEESQRRAEVAAELERMALSGESLARALEVLERRLPFGFWLTNLNLDQVADKDFGFGQGERAPVLVLEGSASEGIEPNAAVFQRFVEALRAELPEARLREGLSPDGARFSLRLTLLGSDAPAQVEDTQEGG
jgi:Tfp pilus assembly PilM family ATPase/Tfp pilus assembly protein PilN